MAGLGVVGVTGLDRDLVCEEGNTHTVKHQYTTPTPTHTAHMCQDSNEVPVEVDGLVENQQYCLVNPDLRLRGVHRD